MSTPIQQLEKLIHEGRFLEARTRTETLLNGKEDVRLMQLLALSMAKSGAAKAAMDLLEPLYKKHPENAETSGILGSIYKELFKETKNSKYAVLSRDTYLNNYQITRNYYTGINAASMHAISGSVSKAKEIARELIGHLNPASQDVWELCTLAEAFLLNKETDKAIDLYLQCRTLLGSNWGKISSIYNQLWLLNHFIPVARQILKTFDPPAVAAFVGHMIDQPGRKHERFPPSIEAEIKSAIAGAIQSVNAKIGYCSLACGGDILFAEAVAESGGEVNLFLPFDESDFLTTSVTFAGEHWVKRFQDLRSKFPVKFVTHEPYGGSDELFSFQSMVILGSALQRAAMLHAAPYLITVYADVDVVKRVGGTYDTTAIWPEHGKAININPQHFIKKPPAGNECADVPAQKRHETPESKNRHVRYLVMIKMENDSEEHYKRLHYHIDKVVREMEIARMDKSDEMIFAFKTIEESLTLPWAIFKAAGLSGTVKISMHAGPVISQEGVSLIEGPAVEVGRAINGFSVPGKVYCTYQFASVLALLGERYAVEYAGIINSAVGAAPVFQLNRHADAFDVI